MAEPTHCRRHGLLPSGRAGRSGGPQALASEPELDDEVGLVGARGFEPPTSSSRTMRATRLRHAPTECPLQQGWWMIPHRTGLVAHGRRMPRTGSASIDVGRLDGDRRRFGGSHAIESRDWPDGAAMGRADRRRHAFWPWQRAARPARHPPARRPRRPIESATPSPSASETSIRRWRSRRLRLHRPHGNRVGRSRRLGRSPRRASTW